MKNEMQLVLSSSLSSIYTLPILMFMGLGDLCLQKSWVWKIAKEFILFHFCLHVMFYVSFLPLHLLSSPSSFFFPFFCCLAFVVKLSCWCRNVVIFCVKQGDFLQTRNILLFLESYFCASMSTYFVFIINLHRN